MNSLLEAYKNTKYKVFEPTITIEIGKFNQDLNTLLLKHKSNEWAFITAYNPFKQSADYFYVSKRDMKYVKSPCYGNNDHKERILFKYSTKGDAYGMFEDYRVKSFEELAYAS